jgi:GNAT superfamily N-acetyltransferase
MYSDAYTLQNHNPEQIDKLAAFIERYLQACPDAKLLSAGFYTYHPALENGRNVFCVLDSEGQVRGFAPVSPAPLAEDAPPADPHHIWTILLADPESGDGESIRSLLLERVLKQAASMATGFPASRRTRLASDMMVSQRADIAFMEANGFERFDGVYVMQRPQDRPIPAVPLPGGLVIRHWRLASEPEQGQYLQAHNQAFPASPKTPESLRFLLDAPLWAEGTAIAAFTPQGELVASILAYPAEQGFGLTDDVFVLPPWRGQDLAKYLIGEGIRYFQERGISDLRLEVLQNNLPAVSVYASMGYEVINQEVFLGRFL